MWYTLYIYSIYFAVQEVIAAVRLTPALDGAANGRDCSIGARARLVLALPSPRDHSPIAPGSGQLHFLLGKVGHISCTFEGPGNQMCAV